MRTRQQNLAILRRVAVVLTMVAIMSLLPVVWSLTRQIDREMRDNLLVQATLATKAIDVFALSRLTGTPADLDSPHYILLKKQLAVLRSAGPSYRFIYIMGQRPNGEVFFYVDSEPDTSQDYSPPGQIYGEASQDLRRIFQTRSGFVEGPEEDQWGTWVSALSPVISPLNDKTLGVLGIDIGAGSWRWDIVAHILPVVCTMIAFLSLLIGGFYFAFREVYQS